MLSSIKVHGEAPDDVLDESAPLAPESLYAKSKRRAEELVLDAPDLASTILRLCPVFGRGDKGNVRRLIRAIDRGYFLLPGNGRARKSLVHAKTVAEVVEAARARSSGSATYVVADAETPSMRELADLVAQLLGRRRVRAVPQIFVDAGLCAARLIGRRVAVADRVATLVGNVTRDSLCDPSHAKRELGVACHADLRAALTDEIDWLRDLGEVRA